MQVYVKWAGRMAVVASMLMLCSCSIIGNLTTRPLPKHEGVLRVAGLQGQVKVIRDKWGVPNIYAQNAHDAFFAQGFTHAQDRWWEMELFRHIGQGRVSEMLGSATIADDIYLRTLRLYETSQLEAEQLPEDVKAMFQAFADGVNAYILTRPAGELAMEYGALALNGTVVAIEPWTPADSLVFGKIIQLQQGVPMIAESLYEDVLAKVGADRMRYWAPPLPYGVKPVIIQPEDLPGTKTAAQPSWLDEALRPPLGSNSWVISPGFSQTGGAILENDPHLGVNTPSLYYEIGLHTSGGNDEHPIEAAGVAFPASPGVAIGHNASIGWGITIGKGVDAWDTYHIRLNPAHPLDQYEWNGQYVDFVKREETFLVAGGPTLTVTIRETIHGPIFNDVFVADENGGHMEMSDDPMAVHWIGLEPTTLGTALHHLVYASNWDEFRTALSNWTAPPCNFSYVDTAGNIGYQLAGWAPVRARGHSGFAPSPGWSSDYLWKGEIPFEDMPHVLNPQRGLLVHTNNPATPPEYFTWLANELGTEDNVYFQATAFYGYRAVRLEQLLAGGAPYSLDDCSAIQADVKAPSYDDVMPYLTTLPLENDAALADVRDWLIGWDGQFTLDSCQATLYAAFWAQLLQDIYGDETVAPQPNDGAMYAVSLLLPEPDNAWWDDISTTEIVETRDVILAKALTEANDNCIDRYGAARKNWRWGKAHTLTFVNLPIGVSGIGLMEWMVNRGPYPCPGDIETVNLAEWQDDGETLAVKWAPCMRMLLDAHNWNNSRISVVPGQSGHPASPNYADQVNLWLKVNHRSMNWSKEAVLKAAAKTLVLKPLPVTQ